LLLFPITIALTLVLGNESEELIEVLTVLMVEEGGPKRPPSRFPNVNSSGNSEAKSQKSPCDSVESETLSLLLGFAEDG